MTTDTIQAPAVSGRAIIDAIRQAGVDYVLSVPDITTSDGLLWPLASDPSLRLVRVCKEDEAIGIAAGLWSCGKRSVILIQNTGFLYAMNAIRAIAVEYKQPIVLLVGLLLKEADVSAEASKNFGVRIVPPMLRTLGITQHVLETAQDVVAVTPAINDAYAGSEPLAFLVGRSPTS